MKDTIQQIIDSLQNNISELRCVRTFEDSDRHYIVQAMRDIQQAVDFLQRIGTPLQPDEAFLVFGDWVNPEGTPYSEKEKEQSVGGRQDDLPW